MSDLFTGNTSTASLNVNSLHGFGKLKTKDLLLSISSTFFVAFLVISALRKGIDMPFFVVDGAFQTASSLYRLDEGYLPGRDFFPYLGIGPVTAIYPFFSVFGGHLAASQAASYLTTWLCGAFSFAVIIKLFFPDVRIQHAVFSGISVAVAFLVAEKNIEMPRMMTLYLEPGHSLLPIRSFAPYLMAASVLIAVKLTENDYWRAVVLGFSAGVLLNWSNDYAVVTVFLFSLLSVYLLWSWKEIWRLGPILTYAAVTLFVFGLTLTLATGGYPLKFILTNLKAVPADQWWYFAPYQEGQRVFKASHLFRLTSGLNLVAAIILVYLFVTAYRTRSIERITLFVLGVSLSMGGTLPAVIGHISAHYFQPIGYFTVLCIACIHVPVLRERIVAMGYGFPTLSLKGLCGTVLLSACFVFYSATKYDRDWTIANDDENRIFVAELGGFLPKDWSEYVAYARASAGEETIEEYWGIWSAINREFGPWKVDSVIHALGDLRGQSLVALDSVDRVVTTRRDYNPRWQPWSVSQNFWFYGVLFESWEPEEVTATTVIWRKLDRPRFKQEVACTVSTDGQGFSVNQSTPGLYSVNVEYEPVDGRHLVFVRNNISPISGGYVSVDPTATEAEFPVVLSSYGPELFDLYTVGQTSGQPRLSSCTAHTITLREYQVIDTPGF